MILYLLSIVRTVKCDTNREIILDFKFYERVIDFNIDRSFWVDGIFKNNPRVNNESGCKLQLHFGYLGIDHNTEFFPRPRIINLLKYATPKLESLELIYSHRRAIVPDKGYMTWVQKTLELPNFQNLYALSFQYGCFISDFL